MNSNRTVLTCVYAATTALAMCSAALAIGPQVIYTKIPVDPSSIVPGALDLAGMPAVTNFRAMEDLYISPDGTRWVLKARTQQGADLETILLIGSGTSGTMFQQEGQPVMGGAVGELNDFFGSDVGKFDDSNRFAFSLRARGGAATAMQKVLLYVGGLAPAPADFTMLARGGNSPGVDLYSGLIDLTTPTGDETIGNSIGSIHLLNSGVVGAHDLSINNINTARRPAIFYSNVATPGGGLVTFRSFKQAGVSTFLDMDGITPRTYGTTLSSNTFFTTPDGAHWLVHGQILGAAAASDTVLIVDGQARLQEDVAIPGGGAIVHSFVNTELASNGDWFARGLRRVAGVSNGVWAASNGVLVAQTGDPAFSPLTGPPENWAGSFYSFTGNTAGDVLLSGRTDNANPAIDDVVVVNGDVVLREGDPIDLNNNGMYDDNVFIGRGVNTNAAFIADCAFLLSDSIYILAQLRDGQGNDLNSNPVFGTPNAFLRIPLGPPPQPMPCEVCGPGPHFMHNPGCPAGTDHIPTSALAVIDTNLDCIGDMPVILDGPSSVQRTNPLDDSNNFPGLRPIDGHIDVIDTEIVSMQLTGGGITLTAGAGLGAIPLQPTRGSVAEDLGDPALADSFFDVFFEVDLGGGNRLYNQQPLQLNVQDFSCLVPDVIFNSVQGCLPLYTSPVPGQGVHVANLTRAYHDLFPNPEACCMPNGTCQDLLPTMCLAQGGQPQGVGTTCANTPCANTIPCEACGPGPHWMHNPGCPGRIDMMPSAAKVLMDTNLDCQTDLMVELQGPTTVRRQNAADDSTSYPGTRPIDGHLDVIDTEMLQMNLTGGGITLTAGAGLGAIPLAATLGNAAEQPGNPNLADSFFDVFFEVDLGGGNRLYNQQPLHVQSTIMCVPPNSNFVTPPLCIPLYTSPQPGQGVHVANLIRVLHDLYPVPCLADLNADGMVSTPDVLTVINRWGPCPPPCPPYCPTDFNQDCITSTPDLLYIINHWGPCPN